MRTSPAPANRPRRPRPSFEMWLFLAASAVLEFWDAIPW